MKNLLLFTLLLGFCGIGQAETQCPESYDYLINNFAAKSPNFEDSEQENIRFIAEQIIAQIDTIDRLDVFGHTATWQGLDLQSLSAQRAELVLDSIVAEVEQHLGREVEFYIYYWGLGDSCPVATNETQSGRATNRRVQVKITQGKSEVEPVVDENCQIGEKLRTADVDVLANSPAHARRLKFLRKFIADQLCGAKQDDRFFLFQAKDGMGRLADKCGTSKQILSAKKLKKKGRVMRGFKSKLSLKTKPKRLAKKVLWMEETITCEINKVFGAIQSLASETPAVRKSDECKALLEMRTASFRSKPDPKSVYRGWRRMISKVAKANCE